MTITQLNVRKSLLGVYIVFCPNDINYPEVVKDNKEIIDGIELITYLIEYDESKWD